jgi:7-keto-8-aminopelargonate synthetase-like enzyme
LFSEIDQTIESNNSSKSTLMIILNSGIGNYVISNNKKYSYFGGNNYLGLANHPVVKESSIQSIKKYGVNFSASRRTTGTADIHLELEKELALFKEKQDAVVFASGYQGNSILLDILRSRYSAVFIDRQAHPSIIASIPGDITNVQYFDHCNASHLETLLDEHGGIAPLVITDGVFALTGEIAPLDKIFPSVNKHNGILIVDDAHSTGILGKNGKGTPEHFNLADNEAIFQTETMSKAMGSYGGFIAGRKELTDSIREKSAIYQASTALPPPIVAASLASLKIIRENPELRVRLLEKSVALRNEIIGLGYNTTQVITPIIPIIFSALAKAKDLSLFLENNGIIVPFMNYPVKQTKYILRISVSASHTADQLELLLEMLNKWKDKNGTY